MNEDLATIYVGYDPREDEPFEVLKYTLEDLIGSLPEEWNWLDGHSSSKIHAKNVHFTRGGPWFRGKVWEPLDKQTEIYSKEWESIRDEYLAKNSS